MFVDPKLARGLTMAEVRAILRHDPAARPGSLRDAGHPVRVAARPVMYRYQTARMPDPPFVRRLAEVVDAIHERDPGTVSREARETVATRSGGYPGFERRYLALRPTSPDPECRSLLAVCTSVIVDDRHVSLNHTELFEIGLHAIERFHERTRSGLVRDAMAAFGQEVLANIGLVWALMDAGLDHPGGPFAIPFADGLALAGCEERPALRVDPYALVQLIGKAPLAYDESPRSRARRLAHPTSMTCRVTTFVGPGEMSPEQVRLRDGIRALAGRHAGHLDHIGDMMTATGRILEGMIDPSYEARTDRAARDFNRDLDRLMAEPGTLRAILGPKGVAGAT